MIRKAHTYIGLVGILISWNIVVVASGTALKEVCQGKNLLLKGNECLCQADELALNPWSESEIRKCDMMVDYKRMCQGHSLHFRPGLMSCYCLPWKKEINYQNRTIEVEKCQQDGAKIGLDKILQQSPSFIAHHLNPVLSPTCSTETKAAIDLSHLQGRSVEVMDMRAGSHGGQRLIVQLKAGDEWDNRMDNPGEQGDSRFGAKALGEKIGEFFGFKILSEHQVVVPDFKELTKAREIYNQKVAEKGLPSHSRMMIGFYPADEGQVTQESYLRHFVEDLTLPLATKEVYFHHDVNFHVAGAIMLPPTLILNLRSSIGQMLRFKKYLQDYFPRLANEPSVHILMDQALNQKVNTLDLVTALLTQYLARSQQKIMKNESSFLDEMQLSFLNPYLKSPSPNALARAIQGPFSSRDVENQFKNVLRDFLSTDIDEQSSTSALFKEENLDGSTIDTFTLLHQRYKAVESVIHNP